MPATKIAKTSGEQEATYFAHFPDGSSPNPTENDGYVHVHLTEPAGPDGSVTVYLPNGTALLVPIRSLLRLVPTRPHFNPVKGRASMNTEQMVVQEVVERVLVSGLVPIDEATWAIYGSIPVDGQVIVAEFDDFAVAESALERIATEQEMVTSRVRDVRVKAIAG